MKILIVEDERRLGQFIKKGLTERSYTATWVPSCREARDALCETGYDAIILDLGLPDGDGLDLLREWRRSGFNEPVLILSARDAVEDRIKAALEQHLGRPVHLKFQVGNVTAMTPADQQKQQIEEVLLDKITAQTTEFPGYAKIRRVAFIQEPWTVENGLLTPTLKLKRAKVVEKHQTEIDRLYAGH